MHIAIITLFPEMFTGVFNSSILKRAQDKQKITLQLINLRDFGIGTHKSVDDKPYGGGAGMVLRIDVLDQAITSVKNIYPQAKIFLMDPKGKLFAQEVAEELSQLSDLVLICGHYEGVDARIASFIDGEISMGDFVLTGGEIPAMAIVDAVARLIPGVLGDEDSPIHESFSKNIQGKRQLEHDHYTRPETYKDLSVPSELLGGDHKKIELVRTASSEKNTLNKRPDL